MFNFLSKLFPDWASFTDPAFRYEKSVNDPTLKETNRRHFLFSMTLMTILLFMNVILFSKLFAISSHYWTETLWRSLYPSTLIIQTLLILAAFYLASTGITRARNNRTWDDLRVTEIGIKRFIQVQWTMTFYRLRYIIAYILIVRIMLLMGVLYDITAFRGEFLANYTLSSEPSLDLFPGLLALICFMTAAFILPFVSLGLEAALGLMLSSRLASRTWRGIFLLSYILFRFLICVALVFTFILQSQTQFSGFLLVPYGLFVDFGLSFMQIDVAGNLWLSVPYSIFIGLIWLILGAFLSISIEILLNLSIKSVEKND